MMAARVVTVGEVAEALPEPEPLKHTASDIDLLVMAAGYEERTLGPLRVLRDSGSRVSQAIVMNHSGEEQANQRFAREATETLELLGAQVALENHLGGLGDLSDAKAVAGAPLPTLEVAVDISAMSGRMVLSVFEAVDRIANRRRVALTVLYAEAASYLPLRGDYEAARDAYVEDGSLGLETDVLQVDVAGNLDGSHDPLLRDLVIALPGFSRDRARAAISHVNPALLLSPEGNVRWWLSEPRQAKDQWRLEAMRTVLRLEDSDQQEVISTFDYRSVFKRLEEVYEDEWLRSNLTVAFHGSKLQAVGVGVFSILRPACRVIVATPATYNTTDYTIGIGEVWRIRFDDWKQTLSELATVGTVRFDD